MIQSKEIDLIVCFVNGGIYDLDISTLDWPYIYQILRSHQLLSLAKKYLEKFDLIEFVPDPYKTKIVIDNEKETLQSIIQKRELFEISDQLNKYNIIHIILKSTAYKWRIYEDPVVRTGRDIDILIRKEDVPVVKSLLKEIGFNQSYYSEGKFYAINDDEEEDETHYELAFTVRKLNVNVKNGKPEFFDKFRDPFFIENGKLKFYSIIDIHWNLNLLFQRTDFFQSCQLLKIENRSFLFLSNEWELVYSSFKLYFEAFMEYNKGLHHYLDIIQIIKKNGGLINPFELKSIISRYNLQACFYYVLNNLINQLNFPMPTYLIELFDEYSSIAPGTNPRDNLDNGDFWNMLFGLR